MSKKMRVLVIGSLLLNVLLVGLIIGDMSHRFRTRPPIGKHARDLASKLPKDKADLVLKTMQTVHLKNRDVYKQIQEARERAMKIMTAKEFDEAAYQTEVKRLHELRGFMMHRLGNVTTELAKQFNQQDRRVLAKYLRRPPRPQWEDRGPHSSDGPDVGTP
jgi:uncharacterized membrane protein